MRKSWSLIEEQLGKNTDGDVALAPMLALAAATTPAREAGACEAPPASARTSAAAAPVALVAPAPKPFGLFFR